MLVVFVIDTSASMNRTTSTGLTLLDYAKEATEFFVKHRTRDLANRGDRFLLVTTAEDESEAVKVGWKDGYNQFEKSLRSLSATDSGDLRRAVCTAFRLLNQYRLQSSIDNYGQGCNPWFIEPSVVLLLTDGQDRRKDWDWSSSFLPSSSSKATEVKKELGQELTIEPFRWDQRLFTVGLSVMATDSGAGAPPCPLSAGLLRRLVGCTPSVPLHGGRRLVQRELPEAGAASPVALDRECWSSDGARWSTFQRLSEQTAGQLLLARSLREAMDAMGGVAARVQTPSVAVRLLTEEEEAVERSSAGHKLERSLAGRAASASSGEGAGAPPLPLLVERGPERLWPLPEGFWVDRNMSALPPRPAIPPLLFRPRGAFASTASASAGEHPATAPLSGKEIEIMHVVLNVLRFPVDTYAVDASRTKEGLTMDALRLLNRVQATDLWPVFRRNSKGDGGLGSPFGLLSRVPPSLLFPPSRLPGPKGGVASLPSLSPEVLSSFPQTVFLTVLPYNYPFLFSLLVEAVQHHAQASASAGGGDVSGLGRMDLQGLSRQSLVFQPAALPAPWRQSMSVYLAGVPVYYHAALRKAFRKLNLHSLVPEVPDGGRSYQVAAYLKLVRDTALSENEKQKSDGRGEREAKLGAPGPGHSSAGFSATPGRQSSSGSSSSGGGSSAHARRRARPLVDASLLPSLGAASCPMDPLALRSHLASIVPALLSPHVSPWRDARGGGAGAGAGGEGEGSAGAADRLRRRMCTPLSPSPSSVRADRWRGPFPRLSPSPSAAAGEDRHRLPVERMGDYQAVLLRREAPRDPLSPAQPDEDTPQGKRRRQLQVHFGNPYRKNATVKGVSDGEENGEALVLNEEENRKKKERSRKRWRKERAMPSPLEEAEHHKDTNGTVEKMMRIEKSVLAERKKLDGGSIVSTENMTSHTYFELARRNSVGWNKILQLIRASSAYHPQAAGVITTLLLRLEGSQTHRERYRAAAVAAAYQWKNEALADALVREGSPVVGLRNIDS